MKFNGFGLRLVGVICLHLDSQFHIAVMHYRVNPMLMNMKRIAMGMLVFVEDNSIVMRGVNQRHFITV
jgi:hypothetical protein